MTARPWRAVAYWPLPGGGRITVARTSRVTGDALIPWLDQQRAAGCAVDWWKIQPIPEVAALTQEAPSAAR